MTKNGKRKNVKKSRDRSHAYYKVKIFALTLLLPQNRNLSNEVLCILAGQRAVKLPGFKV